MTPEMARERREQMLRDGYCVIPDILSPELLLELLASWKPNCPRYESLHVGRLRERSAARQFPRYHD